MRQEQAVKRPAKPVKNPLDLRTPSGKTLPF